MKPKDIWCETLVGEIVDALTRGDFSVQEFLEEWTSIQKRCESFKKDLSSFQDLRLKKGAGTITSTEMRKLKRLEKKLRATGVNWSLRQDLLLIKDLV